MSSLAPALGQIAVLVAALAVAVPVRRALPRPRLHLADGTCASSARRTGCCASTPTPTSTGAPTRCRCWASRWSASSVLFAFGRLQQLLPLSLGFAGLPADGAWNTAVCFVTNTNWQWYSGEAATGHLLQMSGLTVQNFVSRRRRHGRCRGVRPRPGAHRRATAGSATSGPTWSAPSSGSCCRSRSSAAVVLVALGVVQNLLEPQVVHTLDRRDPGTSPAGRSPARRRSRSSAPTAVASTTPTRRTPSRTPRR